MNIDMLKRHITINGSPAFDIQKHHNCNVRQIMLHLIGFISCGLEGVVARLLGKQVTDMPIAIVGHGIWQ